MIIPYQHLEPDTLNRLLQDFVSRDGTDNGFDASEEQRMAKALSALQREQAFIVFDEESQQCQLLAKHELDPAYLKAYHDNNAD
ncbi:YheU family protein [Atopomonas sediminilitoris]|uniref:YheU family protein n=1 Tax=Atopomonas sediminilitoris TaxID=2919919 RepID=UPI001F4D54F1|nr:YheU family protein [Atopomonas sediminilitoris]MCJ8170877.1 YheU family protein [Atopomonas sediminilitoris]